MKIAMSGATGFVGTHLRNGLELGGHEVLALGRQDFNLATGALASRLAGSDVVINLAGAPINRRWTKTYKEAIESSRLQTTKQLVAAISKLDVLPQAFISTSAIGAFASEGCYVESDSPNATDFLGELSRKWEAEALQAEKLGVRTLIFRFALVLGYDGGLMKQVILPFRLGLGGNIGDGSQHFSWIHVDDLVAVYLDVLSDPEASGIYHLCAPNPVTNRVFTRTLGAVLKRPTPLPVPPFMLKAAFGEGADVMTSGQCVISKRLQKRGYRFRYPELGPALQQIVDKVKDRGKPNSTRNTPSSRRSD